MNACTILVSDNSADRTRGMNLMHSCYACGALLCPFLLAAAGRVSTGLALLVLAALVGCVVGPLGGAFGWRSTGPMPPAARTRGCFTCCPLPVLLSYFCITALTRMAAAQRTKSSYPCGSTSR